MVIVLLLLRSSMIGFELYNKTELLEWVLKIRKKLLMASLMLFILELQH